MPVFTPEMDAVITSAQSDPLKRGKWLLIAQKVSALGTKVSNQQVNQHWDNVLDPSVSRTKFTDAEGAFVFAKVLEMGTKFAAIAKFLPGRTANQVKSHYYLAMGMKKRAHLMTLTPQMREAAKALEKAEKLAKKEGEKAEKKRGRDEVEGGEGGENEGEGKGKRGKAKKGRGVLVVAGGTQQIILGGGIGADDGGNFGLGFIDLLFATLPPLPLPVLANPAPSTA